LKNIKLLSFRNIYSPAQQQRYVNYCAIINLLIVFIYF